MAGSPTRSMDNPGAAPQKKKVTTFSCTACGGPVSVRYPGHSLSTICDNCGSVIDTTDENFRVINTFFQKQKVLPRIELGARGDLFGKTWEVIGFVVRQDVASAFQWEEYLLFNPYHGYRWLTCNNGHWSFVTTIKEKPERAATYTRLDNQEYKRFYEGKARVSYVIGEFYWRVAVGEEVLMSDYIAPPKMLSVEEDKTQRVWSVSEYIEPSVVQKAFSVPEADIVKPVGVGANQPSPATAAWNKVGKLWLMFFVVLTGLQFAHYFLAQNKTEYEGSIPYMTKQEGAFVVDNKPESFTSPVFTLSKANSNIDIAIQADVDNSWVYLYGELVNDDTDETYSFERTIEYYHGYDSGESWTEGGKTTSVFMSQVPGGKYYLNLDIDNGGTNYINRKTLYCKINRDVPTFLNYFWCLFFLSILPIILWMRSRSIEVNRWSESDYSPYQSSS